MLTESWPSFHPAQVSSPEAILATTSSLIASSFLPRYCSATQRALHRVGINKLFTRSAS